MNDTTREARALWRAANDLGDVQRLMVGYIRGEQPANPWYAGPLEEESDPLAFHLEEIVRAGFITIGSQPGIRTRGLRKQRAFIDGFARTGSDVLDAIVEPMRALGYSVIAEQGDPDQMSPYDVPVTLDAFGRPFTHLASTAVIPATLEMDDTWVNRALLHELTETVTPVQIIDPQWGRNALFTDLQRLLVANAMRGAVWAEDPS